MSNNRPRLSSHTQKLLGSWNVESITADERYDLLTSIIIRDEAREALPDTNSNDWESLKRVYADKCDIVAVVRRNLNDRYGTTKEASASRLEQSNKVLVIDGPHWKKLIV
jgi:hypothetical protein